MYKITLRFLHFKKNLKVVCFPLDDPRKTLQNYSTFFQIKICCHFSIFYLGKFLSSLKFNLVRE